MPNVPNRKFRDFASDNCGKTCRKFFLRRRSISGGLEELCRNRAAEQQPFVRRQAAMVHVMARVGNRVSAGKQCRGAFAQGLGRNEKIAGGDPINFPLSIR